MVGACMAQLQSRTWSPSSGLGTNPRLAGSARGAVGGGDDHAAQEGMLLGMRRGPALRLGTEEASSVRIANLADDGRETSALHLPKPAPPPRPGQGQLDPREDPPPQA